MALKLGSETGSVVNHVMSGSAARPEVGAAATVLSWTDRHGATVVWVSPSGKTCRVREDRATRADARGMSDCQEWTHEPDPGGREHTFRLGKRGWRSPSGTGVVFGRRESYYDFSF